MGTSKYIPVAWGKTNDFGMILRKPRIWYRVYCVIKVQWGYTLTLDGDIHWHDHKTRLNHREVFEDSKNWLIMWRLKSSHLEKDNISIESMIFTVFCVLKFTKRIQMGLSPATPYPSVQQVQQCESTAVECGKQLVVQSSKSSSTSCSQIKPVASRKVSHSKSLSTFVFNTG